jgi:folate-binding protein YgfZ
VTPGYEALQKNTAIVDLSSRGRIQATGEDRARLLHALSTNHVQQMQPGDQLYCFFLTAQGRIISDAIVVCEPDRFLIDLEHEVLDTVLKHIDHYIIADDVSVEDVTAQTYTLRAGQQWLHGNLDQKEAALKAAGLDAADLDDWRTYRIEQFRPRFGEDISSTTLAQETGIAEALHFQKGCYLGQEIVERIRSRTQVNKMLAGLSLSTDQVPAPGTKVHLEGAETGYITSAVASPVHGDVRALAVIRMQASTPGTIVQVEGVDARVSAVRSIIAPEH